MDTEDEGMERIGRGDKGRKIAHKAELTGGKLLSCGNVIVDYLLSVFICIILYTSPIILLLSYFFIDVSSII